MSLEEVEQRIIRVYTNKDNFLIVLRMEKGFNETEYEELIKLYSEYINHISKRETVNRKAARFLLDIVTLLEGEAYQLSLSNNPLAARLTDAHAETLDLLYQLLV